MSGTGDSRAEQLPGSTWAMRWSGGARELPGTAQGTASANWLGLPLVLLLALALRVWLATTQSAWLDEAWSLQKMARIPLAGLYDAVATLDTKPPLYYAVLHVWVAATGFGVLQARMLSVLFGVAAVLVLYLLADYLFDRATALCAAFLLAISPLATWYSDEIRMYAASGFFALLSVYLLLKAATAQQAYWWALYAVCAVLAFSFDPTGGSLPLAANLYYLLLARRPSSLRSWLVSNAVVVLLAVPTLLLFCTQMADHGAEILYPVPTIAGVWRTILDLISLLTTDNWGAVTFVILLTLGLLAAIRDARDPDRRLSYALVALVIVTPVAVPLAVSVSHSVFLTRTVQSAVYGLLILFARGIVLQMRTRWLPGVVALGLITAINATSIAAAGTTTLKENWTGLTSYADRHVSSGSLVLIDPIWLENPFNLYWRPHHELIALRAYPPVTTQSEALHLFRGYHSVWLVTRQADGGDGLTIDTGTLYLREHFRLAGVIPFHGPTLAHFVSPGSLAKARRLVDRVWAVPDRVHDRTVTLIQVQTAPGAVCTLRVTFGVGRRSPGWVGAAQPANRNGWVAWNVRILTTAKMATAVAPCALAGRTSMGEAHLFVSH